MLKILVLGYGPLGQALVKGVLSCPDSATLLGVIPWSRHAKQRNKRQEAQEKNFKDFLTTANIPMFNTSGVNQFEFTQLLGTLKPDIILVGSWGEIFKPHLLNLPDIQFINCHPSLLPKHRGPNPYCASILSEDTEGGITFHQIDETIDTGPILLKRAVPISPEETGESLREKCAALALEATPELLNGLTSGSIIPSPQSQEDSSYDPELTGDDAWINWQDPPEKITHKMRGLYPWFVNFSEMGRHLVSFELGTLSYQPEKHTSFPGLILSSSPQEILVTTTDPQCQMTLTAPRCWTVPKFLSKTACFLLLRPGKQLITPPPEKR